MDVYSNDQITSPGFSDADSTASSSLWTIDGHSTGFMVAPCPAQWPPHRFLILQLADDTSRSGKGPPVWACLQLVSTACGRRFFHHLRPP